MWPGLWVSVQSLMVSQPTQQLPQLQFLDIQRTQRVATEPPKTLRKWKDDAKQKPSSRPTPKSGTRSDR